MFLYQLQIDSLLTWDVELKLYRTASRMIYCMSYFYLLHFHPLCLSPPEALQLRKSYFVFYPKTSMAETTLVDYPCCMTMSEVAIYLFFKVMFNLVALDIREIGRAHV